MALNQIHSGFDLIDGHAIDLEESISTDGDYTGITCLGTSGEDLVFPNLVYRLAADGEWYKADADLEASTVPMLAMVTETIDEGTTGILLLIGFIRDDDWTLTDGAPVYVSTTAGDIQVAAPGTGDFARKIGFACGTSGYILWFCPDHTVIEVA